VNGIRVPENYNWSIVILSGESAYANVLAKIFAGDSFD